MGKGERRGGDGYTTATQQSDMWRPQVLLLLAGFVVGDVEFVHHNNTMLAAVLQRVSAFVSI